MKEIVIKHNDAYQRLDKFLIKSFPKLSKSMLYKGFRKKRIKVNGNRCEGGYTTQLGDVIQLYINDEFLEKKVQKTDFLNAVDSLDIIYEDENIILVNKPAGLIVHEDENNAVDTLINRILLHLYKSGEYTTVNDDSFTPALCNRIDRNTCGIVIAAKNFNALQEMNRVIKERCLSKKYLLITDGVPAEREGIIENFLLKNTETNTVKAYNKPVPGGRKAITKYRVIGTKSGKSMVEADLVTGRTHQLRVHFAEINTPIIGDTKYGTAFIFKGEKITWQFLCSHKLIIKDDGFFSYLSGREFTVENIWFVSKIWNNL